MRILIAEDDFTCRTLLIALFKREGYNVTAVNNGEDAWKVFQQSDAPELAILDWIMPKMDGLEVIRQVRAHYTKNPPYIILVTIKDDKMDIIAGLDAGANDYLCKPFDQGELRARMKVGRRVIELQDALTSRVQELNQALDQIKTLRGILPICASCKKIRDDKGYWNQVEAYIRDHTYAEFSHAICPECMKKLYPEFTANVNDE